jgi:hypothetical protein
MSPHFRASSNKVDAWRQFLFVSAQQNFKFSADAALCLPRLQQYFLLGEVILIFIV